MTRRVVPDPLISHRPLPPAPTRQSHLVWTGQHVRSLAIKSLYAGLRTHIPGRRGGDRMVDLDTLSDGQWPPLVSRADWFAVQRLLCAPEHKTTRPGRAKHLLSLIGRCGVCLGTLNVAYREDRSLYVCRVKGCVRITQADLDTLAEEVMLHYLARPDVIDTLRAGDHDGDRELSRVRDQLAGSFFHDTPTRTRVSLAQTSRHPHRCNQ